MLKRVFLSNVLIFQRNYGAPGEIRTPDRLVRSQILYPTELRAPYLTSDSRIVSLESQANMFGIDSTLTFYHDKP